MYYPLTPYVFIFTAIPFVILLFALISLYRNARNENGFSSLVVMLLCVGVSLLSLTTAEILVNLIPGLRELRLKIPVAITWLVFLATFIFLAKRERLKVMSFFIWCILGAVSLVITGIPVLIWFGCATGPVCI